MFEGHALAAGWEVNQQRTEDDVHRVEGLVGTTPLDIIEVFKPRVTRYAAYGQDEWNIDKNWSVYLGARWEGIRTDSEGTGLDNDAIAQPCAEPRRTNPVQVPGQERPPAAPCTDANI
ncbi:TonB-dependent receptor domain-containing protein [Pseudoduganella sp. UC29_106]|uniref:TonB-dependent receptor domain-containing protein n=1 Tax=Pseudoduganella sp. UC29_106 TaxID=3374553 RepID=UPI0037566BC9